METEYRWFISGGKPRLINNPTLPDTEFHGSAMAVENYIDPTTGKEASAAKSKFSPPIPDRNFKSFRGMWHVAPNFNNGKPYTGFMLICRLYKKKSFKNHRIIADQKRYNFHGKCRRERYRQRNGDRKD